MLLFLILGAAIVTTSVQPSISQPTRCSVGILRENPDGYEYPLPVLRAIVDSAQLIVRARVTASGPPDPGRPDGYGAVGTLRFELLEILRGEPTTGEIVMSGRLVDDDDFNPKPVPYRIVRPSGQRGNCVATDYRLGGEYLLLLQELSGTVTPYWAPLAPVNEQVRGSSDPWVIWVRREIHDKSARRVFLGAEHAWSIF